MSENMVNDDEARAEDAPVDVVDEVLDDAAAAPGDEAGEAGDEAEAGDPAAPKRSRREEALENEGEIAADYLEELLDIADLDGDIDTFVEGGRAHVSVLTSTNLLVGRDGEVLEALQELARLVVMTETGHRSRLMLDVAGHRDKRRKVLRELAATAIAEVKETGEPVRLAPMNPFERKIVHDVVAEAGLVSESEGEEPQRRVVVLAQD
jgi:spoIIIJ-associated protein